MIGARLWRPLVHYSKNVSTTNTNNDTTNKMMLFCDYLQKTPQYICARIHNVQIIPLLHFCNEINILRTLLRKYGKTSVSTSNMFTYVLLFSGHSVDRWHCSNYVVITVIIIGLLNAQKRQLKIIVIFI